MPLYNISVLREFCKLTVMIYHILSSLYVMKNKTKSQDRVAAETRSLRDEITQWERALPEYVVSEQSGPAHWAPLPHSFSFCKYLQEICQIPWNEKLIISYSFLSSTHNTDPSAAGI